jgi:hypothetical protein
LSREKIIKEYFQSWVNNDISIIGKIFSENAIYTECYGPKYTSKKQILKWFKEWQEKGKVIAWSIKNTYEMDKILVVEWNFECIWEEKLSNFDGVSIVEFGDNNRIINLREFESKSTHYYPYQGE